MAAWQDEYLEKGLLMHFKTASYNNSWTYYFGYTQNSEMMNLRVLAGNSAPAINRYGYSNNSVEVNRENVHKVVQYVLERSEVDDPNTAHMYSQHCYNMRHQMRKIVKSYMHQIVYKEKKVKYNEMVLQMDNGSTESNS